MSMKDIIKTELMSEFKEVFEKNEERLDQCVAVACFLTSNNDASRALKIIEEKMRHRLLLEGVEPENVISYYVGLKKNYNSRDKYKKEKPSKPHNANLLTSVMASIETEAGFGKLHGAPVDVLLKFVDDSEAFRRRIAAGRMMKDPSVTGWHGEHTHRLQWSMISVGKVVADPADLYKFIGPIQYSSDNKRGLWDVLCDRDGGEAVFVPFKAENNKIPRGTDFRAPELLSRYICESKFAKEVPLISKYISARIAKRVNEFNVNSYLLKKINPGSDDEQSIKERADAKNSGVIVDRR